MSRNVLLLTGVSASGKDFVLSAAKEHEPRIGTTVPVVSMGSAIVARMREWEPDVDRDSIKHVVSSATMHTIVAGIVSDLAGYPAAILNGHVTYRQQGVLVSNPDIDAKIDAAAYAVVVADPADIVEWRALDNGRRREVESVDEIACHQEFTVQTAERMAAMLGVECQIIENVAGNTNNSSLTLARMVVGICHE